MAAQALFLSQAKEIFPTSEGNWVQKGWDKVQQYIWGTKYPSAGVESVLRQAFSEK